VQFLCSLNDNVRQFVISKRPANATECAEFAGLYWEILKIGREAERKDASKRNVGSLTENVVRSRPSIGPSRPFGNAGAPYRAGGQNTQNGGKLKPLHRENTARFGAPNSGTYRSQMQGSPGSKHGSFFANAMTRPNASNVCQHVR